jgi:hypothetical protein
MDLEFGSLISPWQEKLKYGVGGLLTPPTSQHVL